MSAVYLSLFLVLHLLWGYCDGLDCPITDSKLHLCVCTRTVIDCSGHSFSTLPAFKSASSFRILKLGNNSFTTVPDNSFASLNVSEIDLSNNQIVSIGLSAFAGVSSSLLKLNLAHNKLALLPNAIGDLPKIAELGTCFLEPYSRLQTWSTPSSWYRWPDR